MSSVGRLGFTLSKQGEIPLWQCEEFLPYARHGFCGRVNDSLPPRVVLERLGFAQSLLLKQVHGNEILEVSKTSDFRSDFLGQADGVILPRVWGLTNSIAIAILTADCVSVCIAGKKLMAVIHAGWRGIAAGIIESAVAKFEARGDSILAALVWPCAGANCYEVGSEVIDAIGTGAVSLELGTGKHLLDLRGTVVAKIRDMAVAEVNYCIHPGCTITEPQFYSYRREGNSAGRNITFLSPAFSGA